MKEPRRDRDVHRAMPQVNWTTIGLIAGLVLLVGIVAYFATGRNGNQDKLSDTQITQAQPANVEQRCANRTTYDLIKAELFRRAAELRGSDQAAFDQLSRVAVIRMDNPVMESEDGKSGAVNCSGSLSLDLPPGVAAVGGRRTLMSDIDYTVDSSGRVALRNADAIIAPLATLSRIAQPAPEVPMPVETNEAAPEANGVAVEPPITSQPSVPQAGPLRPAGARPSFDCAQAHSKSEIAVCSNAGLAALDRNMAAQYSRSIAAATPEQAALLRQTRDRFLRYRDRCGNNSCIGDAYVGRMREVRDIMEGHWSPQR
jgi:hypothetical protein